MKWLVVADPGGHLALLTWLQAAWQDDARLFISVDTPDSRARLAGKRVRWLHGPTQRSAWSLSRNLVEAGRILARERPDVVLTTGAALGVPFVWAARARGVPSVFLEVCDRLDRPSLAGRLMAPWASRVLVQHQAQSALFPGCELVGPVLPTLTPSGRRTDMVYVSLGTHHAAMPRLIRAASTLASLGHHVRVQHGHSSPAPGCDNVRFLPVAEHLRWVDEARLVVLHGGSSSLAEARALHRRPLVVPRNPSLGEHVDDHQLRYASVHGLAVDLSELPRYAAAPPADVPPPLGEGVEGVRQAIRRLMAERRRTTSGPPPS